MGFNQVKSISGGPFFLDVGQSMLIELKLDNNNWAKPGADKGAQWIMADPYPPKAGATQYPVKLQLSNFYKQRDYIANKESIEIDDGDGNVIGTINATPDTIYGVTVTNLGPNPTYFTLQGGGNT